MAEVKARTTRSSGRVKKRIKKQFLLFLSNHLVFTFHSKHSKLGRQVGLAQAAIPTVLASFTLFTMPAAMKVMKATKAKKVNTAMKTKGQKAMTKGSLLTALADATELKKGDVGKILNSLTEIGTEEVKKSGKFVLPGLCMIKTRQKPATKAGKKLMFGKEVMVKAQPAKTVVKASPVAALKSQI